MTGKTKVKISVAYDTGSTCYRTECVVDKDIAQSIIDQWVDVSSRIVQFDGTLNDADANEVSYAIKCDCIKAIDIVEVNRL